MTAPLHTTGTHPVPATDAPSFAAALEHLQSGSEDAVRTIIQQYGPHIRRVVRRCMDRRLRPAFDSLDFTQMVWAAFFQNNAALPTFREPHDLFCYLAALARNKVVDMHRHQFRARRSSGAPAMSLEQLPEHDRAQPLRAPDPTPSQLASAREQWTHLMLRQSERDRRIVRLRAEGATLQDISQQVGIHERTVRKVLKRFRRSLDRESHQLT